jgi:hypothetical protein
MPPPPRAPRHSVGKNTRTPSKAPIILPQKEPSLLRSCQYRANRHGRLSIWQRDSLSRTWQTLVQRDFYASWAYRSYQFA